MNDSEHAQQMARKQFLKRCKQAKELPQIENDKLVAGQPMFFYCKHCGVLCDIVDEEYLFPPRLVCSQCDGCCKQGWIKDFKLAEYFPLEGDDD